MAREASSHPAALCVCVGAERFGPSADVERRSTCPGPGSMIPPRLRGLPGPHRCGPPARSGRRGAPSARPPALGPAHGRRLSSACPRPACCLPPARPARSARQWTAMPATRPTGSGGIARLSASSVRPVRGRAGACPHRRDREHPPARGPAASTHAPRGSPANRRFARSRIKRLDFRMAILQNRLPRTWCRLQFPIHVRFRNAWSWP